MRRLAVVLIVAVLASCGGSSGGKGASLTAQGLAAKTGCTGWTQATDLQLYVQEQGSCTLNGGEIDVYVFRDNTNRDNWLKVAQGFGGSQGGGDRWVIAGLTDASIVKAAVAAAGGKMF